MPMHNKIARICLMSDDKSLNPLKGVSYFIDLIQSITAFSDIKMKCNNFINFNCNLKNFKRIHKAIYYYERVYAKI